MRIGWELLLFMLVGWGEGGLMGFLLGVVDLEELRKMRMGDGWLALIFVGVYGFYLLIEIGWKN
jgi:hypothetical protein